MKLLYVSQAVRIIYDDEGNAYLNHHMNRNVIARYASLVDSFSMFLRDSSIRLSKKDAEKEYNFFPHDLAKLTVGFNIYKPLKNYLNFKARIILDKELESAIKDADKVIFSALGGYYYNRGIKMCRKMNKPYMLLCGGFALEMAQSNTNPLGKICAYPEEWNAKKNAAEAPYVLYVTEHALQERYPCKGKTVGCSDVEVPELPDQILNRRLEHISNNNGKIIFGTAAGIDDKRKGQKYVLHAIKALRDKGIENIEYQLLGAGDPSILINEAERLGIRSQLKILGMKPHSEVYEWLDNVDIYVQPSYSEGLCRAVVEAMSRACPVITSNCAGNLELCEEGFSFTAGNTAEIEVCLMKVLSKDVRIDLAGRSFNKAKNYEKDKLDKRRNDFLKEFIES